MRQTGGLTEVKPQPFREVFQAELEEIRERRKQCLDDERGLKAGPEAPSEPSTDLNLVGLAFSGGGIRSASFGLGVVQELARRGLLKFVDYLSTVSGGGYLGSCLSSVLADSKSADEVGPRHFPLRKQVGEAEPPVLRHLRNGSNYLKPPGLLNSVGLAVVVLRGFLLTFLALLPMLYAAAFVTALLYEVVGPELLFLSGLNMRKMGMTSHPSAMTAAAFFALVAIYPFFMVAGRRWMDWRNRRRYQNTMAAMLLATVVLVLLWPVLRLVDFAAYTNIWELEAFLRGNVEYVLTHPVVLGLLAVPVALAFFAAGRKVLKVLGIAVAAAIGPFVLFVTYLLLCHFQVDPPRKFELTDKGAELLSTNESVVLERALDLSLEPSGRFGWMLVDKGPEKILAQQVEFTQEDKALYDRATHKVVDGEHLLIAHEGKTLIVRGALFDPDGILSLIAAAIIVVLNFRFLNINYTSPHGFYRDQLSQVFLVKEKGTDVEHNDAMKLSQLREPSGGGPSGAPYHLINAAINLGSDTERDIRGRKAGMFIFSKHFVGSEETGWCRTEHVEQADPHLSLGTAMAISGAAASPYMGSFTTKAFSFLMMLLNIRLGYWLPNPERILRDAAKGTRKPFWCPGPKYLLKEAMGLFDTRGSYVNVSDGGHIENLGVYELLRRRCKVIIAVDGEADPQLRFGSLVTLLRFARIDMGISIQINLDELRKADAQSKAHWAVGEIDYGGGERGTLIYIKSTLTGDESPYVRAYHESQPAFPHESTANQFFTETQLEVYRALGEHITESEPLRQRLTQALSDPGRAQEVATGSTVATSSTVAA
jgi:hypothetical protein